MGLKHAKDVGLLAGNQQMLGVTKVDVGNDVLREENAANWFDMITNWYLDIISMLKEYTGSIVQT